MKKVIMIAGLLAGSLEFHTGFAQSQPAQTTEVQQAATATFKVYGNCGMCKKRIEKAANSLEGMQSASWHVESKKFTARFDAGKLTAKDIEEKIAAAGHDTETVKASDAVYKKLPGCCQYSRD